MINANLIVVPEIAWFPSLPSLWKCPPEPCNVTQRHHSLWKLPHRAFPYEPWAPSSHLPSTPTPWLTSSSPVFSTVVYTSITSRGGLYHDLRQPHLLTRMWKKVTEQDLQGQPQPLILLNRILTLPNIELNSNPNLNSTKQKERGGGDRRQPWKWMWSMYIIYRDQNAVCCAWSRGMSDASKVILQGRAVVWKCPFHTFSHWGSRGRAASSKSQSFCHAISGIFSSLYLA